LLQKVVLELKKPRHTEDGRGKGIAASYRKCCSKPRKDSETWKTDLNSSFLLPRLMRQNNVETRVRWTRQGQYSIIML
jgi:hypothetical protein